MTDLSPTNLPLVLLKRARSDLALAHVALETAGVLPEDACFHAQQCAEKALKALLIHLNINFPRTHTLEVLIDLLIAANMDVPQEVDDSFVLSEYAVETRYPSEREPVTEDETLVALKYATLVLAWVEQHIGR